MKRFLGKFIALILSVMVITGLFASCEIVAVNVDKDMEQKVAAVAVASGLFIAGVGLLNNQVDKSDTTIPTTPETPEIDPNQPNVETPQNNNQTGTETPEEPNTTE